jgi:hypothetical protein
MAGLCGASEMALIGNGDGVLKIADFHGSVPCPMASARRR